MEKPIEVNEAYVLNRYQKSINYYWSASRKNKKSYKLSRSLTIIFGASVTLISAISSAEFIVSINLLKTTFAVLTPILAAMLTIIGGFAQSFHWGATWRDMVICAESLEKERDRFQTTTQEEKNLQNELDVLNTFVLDESRSFFKRVLDSEAKPAVNNG